MKSKIAGYRKGKQWILRECEQCGATPAFIRYSDQTEMVLCKAHTNDLPRTRPKPKDEEK
jgi:hypothetical protein